MDYNLGTAHGVVEITSDTSGLRGASTDIKNIGDQAKKSAMSTKEAWNKVGTASLIAGGAIAGGLAIATKTAMDFEKRVSAIGAVSGATGADLDALREKALQIGKDTAFSAAEGALAIEELAKAGIKTKDILSGAADATVALAAAGEVDLPFAASVASNAMNQFNLSANDMTNVADAIAGAANASAIDVKDFGMSLAQVGAVANLAGLDFNDTAIAIAELGNAGIKGSDAGTSLKSMLMRLQPQTKSQIAAMSELGIITKDGANRFYDAQGRLKSLSDIQQILNTSLKGMTKEQKQATLQTIFGSDAIRAAAILSNEGAKGYTKMAGAIGKTSAAEVAAARLDNLAGSWEQLKGSLETLAIQLGSVLLPALKTLADFVTGIVNAFIALPDGVKTAIVAFAGIAAAVLLIGGSIIKAVSFVQGLIGAFKAIGLAWQALNIAFSISPIGLIIIGIIALVAALIWLWNNCETFRNVVITVWEAIKEAVLAVWQWFQNTLLPGLKTLWDAIVQNLYDLKETFTTVWNAIVAVVQFVFNAIKAYVTFYFNVYRTIITTALNVIKAIFTGAWNAIKAVVQFVLNLIKAYITAWVTVITAVIRGVQAVYEFVRGVFQRVYETIRTALTNAVNFVRGIPQRILSALGNLGSLLLNAGKLIMQGFLNGLKAGFGPIADFVGGIASWIGDHKGPKSKDQKLLVRNGKWIMGGLSSGLRSGYKDVQKDVSKMGAGISKAVGKNSSQASLQAGGGSAGGSYDLNLLAQEATLQKLLEEFTANTNAVLEGSVKGKGKKTSEGSGGGGGATLSATAAAAVKAVAKSTTSSSSEKKKDVAIPLSVSRSAIPAGAYASIPKSVSRSMVPAGAYAQSDFHQGKFGGGDFNVVVNNPVPERASDSLTRTIRRATYLGLGDL